MTTTKAVRNLPPHPMDSLLRTERIPHIWCPGCGIGTVFGAVLAAIKNTGWDPNSIAMVSGIGCTGRMAGYIRLDSFHTTHGRALPFATGLKLARPQTKIIVHAARRNMDLTVVCVNNLNYGMTGGQQAPSTPLGAKTTTTVNGSPEEPFNFCDLASTCGATYVARWTAMQVRSLRSSISEALEKRGFSFVEVITPCPSSFGRRNRMGTALEMLKFYQGRSVIRGDIDPREATVDIDREIVVGKFVDIERPTFMDHYEKFNRPQMPQWRPMHPDTQKGR
jgi:2-oxoglutarate ferredoxin oxidoreductase subunit beta